MPTVFATRHRAAPAAPWRSSRAGWVVAGLLFDLAAWELAWPVARRLWGRTDGAPGEAALWAAVGLAVLACWVQFSVLPTLTGRRRLRPARLALELGAAASAVALGFVAGFAAGLAAFVTVGSALPTALRLPPGPVATVLVSTVLMAVVVLVPVFLGGVLASWVMGLATDGQAGAPRWRSVAGGWAAVVLAPLAWLPSAHAVSLAMLLLVPVAALPGLLLTVSRPQA